MRLFYLTILSYPTIVSALLLRKKKPNSIRHQFGILVVKKFSGDFNKELVNVSIIVRNDGIHDSMLDIWWEQFVVVQNFFISSRMSVPENDNDLNYQKEIFRATFDGARLINQGYSSAIGRLMLESMFTFIDFELKLPFKKVKEQFL